MWSSEGGDLQTEGTVSGVCLESSKTSKEDSVAGKQSKAKIGGEVRKVAGEIRLGGLWSFECDCIDFGVHSE